MGGAGGDAWYAAKVNAWVAAGIFPAFSAGNSGLQGCSTLGSPGDYQASFASAAHDVNRNNASFSSRGPSAFGHTPYTKPNISAPGVSICSTVPTNGWNCGYSGTSMASPHTAGAVAQLWSCAPSLVGQIDATFQALQNSADTPPAGTCGVPPDGQGNYTYGYGYLDVLNLVSLNCGNPALGTLQGHVYDQNNNPVTGATVIAIQVSQGNSANAFTDPTGFYTMKLATGTYNVTAAKTSYSAQTISGSVIATNQTTTQDFTIVQQGTWTEIPLPVSCPDWNRFDGEYYPLTGKVYFMGGRSGTTTYGTIYSYDPVSNTCVNTGATMLTPISNYTINLVNNGVNDLLCTFGGRDSLGGQTLAVQCYNPVANTVNVVNNLPDAWAGYGTYSAVVVNNMAYIFGGFRSTSPPYMLARTDRYDPVLNTFTQMGNMSIARSYIMAAAVDGKVYAFGGNVWDGANLNAQTIAEVFNPLTQSWDDASIADLPIASGEGRAYGFNTSSSSPLAGTIVIAGGGQFPNDTNEVLVYDVSTNTYESSVPNLKISRRDQAAFFIPGNGTMWVFGGHSSAIGYGGDNPPYAPPEYFPTQRKFYLPFLMRTQ